MLLKRVGQGGAALALAILVAFFLNKVADVTLDDATNYFKLGPAQANLSVSGGDIYAVSPDGLIQEKICAMALQEEFVNRIKVDAVFSNVIADSLPFVAKLVSWGADADLLPDSDTTQTRLRFSGEFTELLTNAPMGAGEDCERQMVKRSNARYLICIVRSSLIPEGQNAFSAYRFDSLQIWLPEEIYGKFGAAKGEAAKLLAGKPCPTQSGVPWDVAFRAGLRLIKINDAQPDDRQAELF
ncbi:MAG: hypothetical protein KDA50_07455 [Rhodobacteraceae bacterium]|nr:hypothetical protein [Paracoccaceae bacterium]